MKKKLKLYNSDSWRYSHDWQWLTEQEAIDVLESRLEADSVMKKWGKNGLGDLLEYFNADAYYYIYRDKNGNIIWWECDREDVVSEYLFEK